MSVTPLVSIIIPTFNRAHLISETLDSVLAQTYQNWECIVVDDGSTDGTDTLLTIYTAKDSRFQYHHRPETHLPGGNGARNYGFQVSKGEYIQWFDSDDLMVAEKISRKVKKLLCNGDLAFCISGYGFLNNEVISIEDKSFISKDINIWEAFICKKIKVCTPSALWSRKFLLEQEQLFDEQIYKGQDLDFHSRMFYNLELKYTFVNKVLTLVKNDSGNSIMQLYVQQYNTSKAASFLEVRRKIHFMALNVGSQDVYYKSLNFYLQSILISLQQKDFDLAINHLKFMKHNQIKKSMMLNLQHLRCLCIGYFFKIFNLKGYWYLKNLFIIN